MEHRQGGRGKALTRERETAGILPFFRRRRMRAAGRPILAAICALFCIAIGGCARPAPAPRSADIADAASERILPRAHPSYLQWLERQSMLGAAPALSAQVSGAGLVWNAPAGSVRPDMLLRAAPSWLHVTPSAVVAPRPLLREAARPEFSDVLKRLGVSGLYFAPIGEPAAAWLAHSDADVDPDAVTGFTPAESLGTEDDFSLLANALEDAGIQMGGDLPPAAGGMGPDFFLQARRAPRFDGIYAMIEVPRSLWRHLPVVPEDRDCLPLTEEALAPLRDAGVLPPELTQDRLGWGAPCGWAVTGEIRGADGDVRRHAYRWHGRPSRPVLLWQDPSGQARRALSAAIIRHTGLKGQALAGIRAEAFMGLERPSPAHDARNDIAPGDEALAALSREIHRYGGWALQADPLPEALLHAILDGGADFARDTLTEPAAERALLTGDAAPLASAIRRGLDAGTDFRRLAHGLDGGLRVSRLLVGTPRIGIPEDVLRRIGASDAGADPLLSPVALALLAQGHDPAAFAPSSRPDEAGRELRKALRDAALLLLGVRAALPGPLFVGLHELTGAVVVPRLPLRRRVGIFGPASSADANMAPLAFGSVDAQLDDPESFASRAAALLRARSRTGLARGRLLAVAGDSRGRFAIATALPDGGRWLAFANFSAAGLEVRLRAPFAVRGAKDALTGHPVDLGEDDRSPAMFLKARHIRHVLIGPADKSAQGDQA